jgi:hypothetical protein
VFEREVMRKRDSLIRKYQNGSWRVRTAEEMGVLFEYPDVAGYMKVQRIRGLDISYERIKRGQRRKWRNGEQLR